MSGARRATIALGAALMALAAFAALWPALRAGWRAATSASAAQTQAPDSLRIVAVDSSDRSLQLRFERSNGAVGHLALVRDGPESPWRAEPAVGAPGVLLGDGYPVFATPRFLAVHGLDSSSALRPIDASIAEETADDVSVIRFWGGEIAICLWRHGKVVRAGLAGPIFEALRATTVARDPPERAAASNAPDAPGEIAASDACGRLAAILRADDAAIPRTAACAAALAACPSLREAALDRLREICEAGDLGACDLLLARGGVATELWPEIDDCWRWIADLIDQAPSR